MPQTTNPILTPGTIYRTIHGELVEYVSTSGKNNQDKEVGFRFYHVATKRMETVDPDSLLNFIELRETP